MTKSELIKRLASAYDDVPEQDVASAIQRLLQHLTDALANGERIEIRGFGSFSVRHRPPRQARNPKTGEVFETATTHVPYFRPGKELKERANRGRGA
jgi:integration host factor subunit beta